VDSREELIKFWKVRVRSIDGKSESEVGKTVMVQCRKI